MTTIHKTKLNYTAVFLTSLMGFSTVTTSIFSFLPANAQLFPASGTSRSNYNRNNIIPLNTKIPVKYDKAEKIVVTKDETVELTLQVAGNLKNRYGTLLIPYESQIVGKLEPFEDGTRFVAEELIINDTIKYPLNAVSQVITKTEEIKEGADVGTYLKNAAIGAAAAAAISGVTGNRRISVGEVLIGAGAGALGTLIFGKKTVEVISIDPNVDLDISLLSALTLDQ